ncbi:MAG: DapH/DapD/GlmU-related protein [Acidobacteriota bacterium]|nr:DapH/DapD/GlmU-related protein [Acidobacteriota bacterium]
MRVCCSTSLPFTEAPVAGVPPRERILAAAAHLDVAPFFGKQGENPGFRGEVLWMEGLFPLITPQDIDAFLTFGREHGSAVWPAGKDEGLAFHSDWPEGAGFADVSADAATFSARPAPTSVRCGASLAACNREAFLANASKAMDAGVLILAPETTWIEDGVSLAPGVIIEPNVYLGGATRIAAGVRIGMGAHLRDCRIGTGTLIKPYCVLDEAEVGADVNIGPFAHVRPGSVFGDNVRVGNFVETKKASLGEGSKASHLTYLGDTQIGKECNVGAGTITCNYDGFNKHLTKLGDGVFIGSNSALVAPVNLADGAFVAAGSCITDDVPKDSLALGRARQTVKEGLAGTIRERARQMKEEKKKAAGS